MKKKLSTEILSIFKKVSTFFVYPDHSVFFCLSEGTIFRFLVAREQFSRTRNNFGNIGLRTTWRFCNFGKQKAIFSGAAGKKNQKSEVINKKMSFKFDSKWSQIPWAQKRYYSWKCVVWCFSWRRNNFRGNNSTNSGGEGTIWENCSLLREQKNAMVYGEYPAPSSRKVFRWNL